MARPMIAMMDVRDPYRAAIRAAASENQLQPVEVHEFAECTEPHTPVLAVIQTLDFDSTSMNRVESVRKMLPLTPSVVLARRIRPQDAFWLAQLGVTSLIELPVAEREVARQCLNHAVQRDAAGIPELIGTSPAIQELRQQIASAARSSATVLLTGETGTGKGLVARAIHQVSKHGARPFLQVNCAALASSLIESELFGHERGAFTGAVTSHAGCFERVNGGTIFLDEIGDLELPLQSKFLRVLEDREFERVGGTATQRLTGRAVAATNRDLARGVADGGFREDLYYRLRVLHIHLPPLREHLSDIPLLVDAALRRLGHQLDVPVPAVAPDFCDRLTTHPWNGNVRELLNVLEAALLRTPSSRLREQDLDGILHDAPVPGPRPAADEESAGGAPSRPPLGSDEEEECARLRQLLVGTGGNIARVARRMGMARSTVRYKILRYGLTSYIPRD